MSDFITLSCPNCGGKLSISPNTSTLICQHCGTEHMVRWQAGSVLLESFARCPQCNRNDRVQKISATLATKANTLLAQKLSLPSEPVLPARPVFVEKKGPSVIENVLASFIIGLFGIFSFVLTLRGNPDTSTVFVFSIGVILTIIAIVNIIRTIQEPSLQKKRIEKYDEELSTWNKIAENYLKTNNERALLMKLRDQLYYCDRDDCVFIPGTNTYAPASNMMDYLYIRAKVNI